MGTFRHSSADRGGLCRGGTGTGRRKLSCLRFGGSSGCWIRNRNKFFRLCSILFWIFRMGLSCFFCDLFSIGFLIFLSRICSSVFFFLGLTEYSVQLSEWIFSSVLLPGEMGGLPPPSRFPVPFGNR